MTDMFEPDNELLQMIVRLAQEADITNHIDWEELNLSEHQALVMMATHVVEMDLSEIASKAIITKLLVENFALNTKILTLRK